MKSILFISLAIVVSSCTTLSKEDCHTINWHERGKSDALKDKTSTVFADYAKTCSKHGIAVDQDSYAKGREGGLKFFERRKKELEEQEAKLRVREASFSGLMMSVKLCTSNSDCTVDRQCSFGKCEGSGAKSSFNSDCEIEGRCSAEKVCAGRDCHTVNFCKYD